MGREVFKCKSINRVSQHNSPRCISPIAACRAHRPWRAEEEQKMGQALLRDGSSLAAMTTMLAMMTARELL
jgi:hypothetical protein